VHNIAPYELELRGTELELFTADSHLALKEIYLSAEFGIDPVLNYYKTLCFIPPRSKTVFQ
jgi:hypothetical protein